MALMSVIASRFALSGGRSPKSKRRQSNLLALAEIASLPEFTLSLPSCTGVLAARTVSKGPFAMTE
jgi:hypothetical protein